MCRDSHSSLRGIPSVWLSNSFMAEGSHSVSQPAKSGSVCLISQFTCCFIGSYYGHHGDAIRFYGLFGLRAESVINEEKKTTHTHTRENKDSQNTLLLWKGLLSLPSSLPPSLFISLTKCLSSYSVLHVKHGQANVQLSSLIPHLELIRGPPGS